MLSSKECYPKIKLNPHVLGVLCNVTSLMFPFYTMYVYISSSDVNNYTTEKQGRKDNLHKKKCVNFVAKSEGR